MSTPTNQLDTLRPAPVPGRVGQGTAVEQSRAVAEVQAAVIVAQQVPRSIAAATAAMREACQQLGLAKRAFYSYSRAGSPVTGPTVHLARELARCWGNVQYGITELRRDDEARQSEMQAWAWDVQTNTRNSTTFIVPHSREKGREVVELTGLRDVYENNANMGARRVREMIFALLPTWYTDEAEVLARATLEKGDGQKPFAQRTADAIRAFRDQHGVTQAQLEKRQGRKADDWTPTDLANLEIVFRSLVNRETTLADEFPTDEVDADDLKPRAAVPAATAAQVADAEAVADPTTGEAPQAKGARK